MLVHVNVKMDLLDCAVVTNVAFVPSVIRVDPHVGGEGILVSRFVITHRALKHALLDRLVRLHVRDDHLFPPAAVRALRTFVNRVIGGPVFLHVVRQLAFISCDVGAAGAPVREETKVERHVELGCVFVVLQQVRWRLLLVGHDTGAPGRAFTVEEEVGGEALEHGPPLGVPVVLVTNQELPVVRGVSTVTAVVRLLIVGVAFPTLMRPEVQVKLVLSTGCKLAGAAVLLVVMAPIRQEAFVTFHVGFIYLFPSRFKAADNTLVRRTSVYLHV